MFVFFLLVVGFFYYFFFSFSRKLSALAPSLLKEVSFHLADTQTHTLDNSHPRQQRYNKDLSILSRTRQIAKCHITTPIIKGPYAPISSTQLQTTEWLCFSQWQAVWHGSHPPSKCLCLFACYLTRAGLSRHLLTPRVWVATYNCRCTFCFTYFSWNCNFYLTVFILKLGNVCLDAHRINPFFRPWWPAAFPLTVIFKKPFLPLQNNFFSQPWSDWFQTMNKYGPKSTNFSLSNIYCFLLHCSSS